MPRSDGRQAELPAPSGQSETQGATIALLDLSRSDRDAGNLADAAATIERGLTIDPNSALLWIELAEIRAEQGARDLARTLASKALTLAGSDRSIRQRADRLLSR